MQTAPALHYEFGDYTLDTAQFRLARRDGTVIELTPRQFEALVLLVHNAGELLDKEQMLATLWPGLVVEDNNLNQVISGLRRALGDDSQHSRYIQTVPRRGFRFVAAVSACATPSSPAPDAPAAVIEGETIGPPVAPAPAEPALPAAPRSVFAERRTFALAMGGAALAMLAATVEWRRRKAASTASPEVAMTLAVLPFKPLVLDGRNELLEVGMADSLIARLSTAPGLVVRSVGSVRRYAGPDQDPLRAARELDVAWIVDGSLQRWGDQVRVTARLLRAADGVAQWSGSFDETYTGMFDVQDAISERVALVLMPQLGSGERRRLTGIGGTRNADAYQYYLDARWHAQGIRASGLRTSVELFRKAIQLDPAFALAYSGIAESYRRMIYGDDVVPKDVLEPAGVAARQALGIDPDLAEAHAGMGWVAFWYEWDWARAEQVFRRAIALNPNVVEAHFGLGSLLLARGRFDEGQKQIQWARELDPLSLILNTLDAGYLLSVGRRDEGRARLLRVMEIEPNFWVAHLTMADFLLADGKTDEALQSLRSADRLAEGSTVAAAVLGYQLGRAGRRDEAQAVLRRLRLSAETRYVPPTTLASLHAGLGDTGAALDSLERAFEVSDTRLVYLRGDERWVALRVQPRFIALLKRLKLEPIAASTGSASASSAGARSK